jgi:hypothetical protein
MKLRIASAVSLLGLLVLAGCASTNITNREILNPDAKLARPDRIIIYDFSANPSDVPFDSQIAEQRSAEPPSAEQIQFGDKLGAEVAKNLVQEINDMGLHAVRAEGEPPARVNDIVVRGYFLSVDKGNMAKRIAIGFGSGSADLTTLVEGYQMTSRGLRRLGSGEVQSGGSRAPGVAVPLVVSLATMNPIGIAVGGAVKVGSEIAGVGTIEKAGKDTAEKVAAEMRKRFVELGWIED